MLGIISIPFCLVLVPSILAVVFGGIGMNRAKQDPAIGGRGRAIAGLVLGSVSFAIVVLLIAVGRGV